MKNTKECFHNNLCALLRALYVLVVKKMQIPLLSRWKQTPKAACLEGQPALTPG
jgi:hypothetical protein